MKNITNNPEESGHAEQLFKEAFEHFEADINPQVWANVQSGLNSVGGSAASAAAKFAIGKIVAGTASVVLVAGSVWYFASSDNKTISSSEKQNQTKTASRDASQNTISENQSSENIFTEKMQRRKDYLNQNSSDNSHQTQIVSGSGGNTTDASSSENTTIASVIPEHKYGKSSDKPTSLVRGVQTGNSKSKILKENSASDEEHKGAAYGGPSVKIFASIESGDVPLTAVFSNEGILSSLHWDFGDGSTSEEFSPVHTFEKPGTYTVKLTAKNSAGIAADKIKIEVNPISGILSIPNIFTPNGDGINDYFSIETKNISKVQVEISDRGGNIIAGWNTLEGNWNGKLSSGDDAPEGVYLYTIQATGTDGESHHKRGPITLKRAQ